jgi:hypothetical protein
MRLLANFIGNAKQQIGRYKFALKKPPQTKQSVMIANRF